MKLLAVDTSAKACSVSIVSETQVLSEFKTDTKLTHSQTLMPMIKAALECSKISLSDIDGFAVSAGPGSFTGLRIGIGAIKGLSYATQKPCASVSTLEALAYNMQGVDGIICAAMDARCSQVYAAVFESSPNNQITRLSEDNALAIDELIKALTQYKKNIFFVGDGSELCYNKAEDILENCFLADCGKRFQNASMVGMCGIKAFGENKTCTAQKLSPIYLRLPQAQRERMARLNQEK